MQSQWEKDLAKVITDALQAIEAGRYAFADEGHVDEDMSEFGLKDAQEYLDLIFECLQIASNAPLNCYRHPSPSISSRHTLTKRLRMWAFVVKHESYPEEIYFKFCLSPQPDGTYYFHIDCHGSDQD